MSERYDSATLVRSCLAASLTRLMQLKLLSDRNELLKVKELNKLASHRSCIDRVVGGGAHLRRSRAWGPGRASACAGTRAASWTGRRRPPRAARRSPPAPPDSLPPPSPTTPSLHNDRRASSMQVCGAQSEVALLYSTRPAGLSL